MLKANKAADVPAQREDHHATRTGEFAGAVLDSEDGH
jgi:hypothetical protein